MTILGEVRQEGGGTLLQHTPPAMSSVQGAVAQSHGEGIKGSSGEEGSQLDQVVAVLTFSVLAANAEAPWAEETAPHLREKEPASTCRHTALWEAPETKNTLGDGQAPEDWGGGGAGWRRWFPRVL